MHSEYEFTSVAAADRRGFPSLLVVMLGFTFFSASMWAGATLGNGLRAWTFLGAVLAGNLLLGAYTGLLAHIAALRDAEKVQIATRCLARFEPVPFAPEMTALVERHAKAHGLSTRRMPSGAGHDAQMLAAVCPSAMIFVPSVEGISHNVREFTQPHHIEAGANVLLSVLCELAGATKPAGVHS